MDFRHQTIASQDLAKLDTDALLIVVSAESKDFKGLSLPTALNGALLDALKEGDVATKAGRVLYLHRPVGVQAARVVISVAANATPKAFRAAVGKGLSGLKELGAKQLHVASVGLGAWTAAQAEALVTVAGDTTYVYNHTKPSAPKPVDWRKLTVVAPASDAAAVDAGLKRGQAIAAGVAFAREQANRPGNYCTPRLLADAAKQMAKEQRLKIEVLDRPAIEKLRMGSFLSVSRGSDEPPRFIVLRYEGAPKSQAPIVLVGKGVTFDTGGISLKPGAEMDEMKFDMGGAASVLGTFRAIAELRPKINLIGLIPATENMPSGSATKPGDVVTSMSGQTIEVLNTDAEGRLILCDALTYAERFKPAAVVDIATLTGACIIALGHIHSGLFSSDDELADSLLKAGRDSLDTAWRMPLDDEYEEGLKSNFADMGNIAGRAAGSVTAASFLKKFTKAYRWAHLDIAGTAWKSGAAKGGTGRPVPLLTHFVLSQAELKSETTPTKAAARKKVAAKAPAKVATKPAGRTAKPAAKKAAARRA